MEKFLQMRLKANCIRGRSTKNSAVWCNPLPFQILFLTKKVPFSYNFNSILLTNGTPFTYLVYYFASPLTAQNFAKFWDRELQQNKIDKGRKGENRTELEGNLFIRGPLLWNGLNNKTGIQDDLRNLKKFNLEQISFVKSTCVNIRDD